MILLAVAAPLPGDAVTASEHWAFQPPAAPELAGDAHPVDELLAGALRARGLAPASAAPRAVLLRRAWHVLTGLMPGPEVRARWDADGRDLPAWTEAVVEEALASEHFGERWARYWLDLARYADTKGYNFQGGRRYPYAFTYRDWVARSFNEDLPHDEFLRRQVAADLMGLPPSELAALGYLTVGRRFLGKEDLIIADRIDVVFRGAMALTMQCVRCHDHKSDPLSMADYYGIYGIFDSTREPEGADLPVIAEPEDSPGYREFLAELTKRANAAHDYAEKKIGGYERPADPLVFDRHAAKRKLNQAERGEYEQLIAKMAELEATSEFAPPRAMVLHDHDKPREPRIFERGQRGSDGPKVPRAFPAFFREQADALYTKEGSGRLELAHDLTRRSNPLTARVWANRVWMHVMGEPLVSSPGDFGVQTPAPLHRELLDHLAVYLMDHGWSTKALIRHIMTSEAWRHSSAAGPELLAADPENRYYARSNRVRKDLEAWRDTTLQASGRLDHTVGGRPVSIHDSPFPPRRSIYGLIERQNPPSFFRIFDFPESNQPVVRRARTTTPNQALYLMNSPFLHGEAKAAAARAGGGDAESRIAALYRRILLREPDAGELRRAREFLAAAATPGGQSAGAWSYGHGRLHRDSGQVEFTPFTHFTGKAWQVSGQLPDPEQGWVSWHAAGGHPGHGNHATILRWEAPHAAEVRVEGRLERPSREGDGVRALLVSNGAILGEWEAHPGDRKTRTEASLTVESGQVVDFVVESKGNEGHDSFQWAPVIEAEGEELPLAEANAGFSGPALDAWSQLAQVLLLSNEFLFID